MTFGNLPKSANEFIERYSAGERNFSKIKLIGANLSGKMLSGAILRAADLQDVDLSKADLSGANLSGIPLKLTQEEADDLGDPSRAKQEFKESDFQSEDDWLECGLAGRSGSNLSKANLRQTNLSGADLRKANLSGADLTGANLTNAKLTGADLRPFSGDYDKKGTALRNVNLNGAVIRKIRGWGIDISHAQINEITQLDNDLSLVHQIINKGLGVSGSFVRADLRRVNLEGANLSNADLTDANLMSAFLEGANLRGADLSGAELNHANLSNADLVGANLRTAKNLKPEKLKGIKFDEKTRFPKYIDISQLNKSSPYTSTESNKTIPLTSSKFAEIKHPLLPISKIRLHIDDIDSFAKVRDISCDSISHLLKPNGYLDISEEKIQIGLEKILNEPFHKKDWGGEYNDLYTSNLVFNGTRISTAFLLKGNGLKPICMEIKHCGKNGDQIRRLFESPAELFIIQFVGNISEAVVKEVEEKVELRKYKGKQAYYCILNGQDTARLLCAYGLL
ncbi:hypothetical protein NIES4074_31190 [Cylindrospermum sp. NIES-4074]|nr:hypothetical protein NIES4074_31190 [Cylindrospermum sp. NIES-4074]